MQKCRYKFTGEYFRRFLQQNSKTYHTAAKELSINKNTIGNFVRGGNTTIAVLLRIANRYSIPIEEFFEDSDISVAKTYDDSLFEMPLRNNIMLHSNNEHSIHYSEISQSDRLIITRLNQIYARLDMIVNQLNNSVSTNEK
ncbi:MAG: helix-turn-helix transcriptional regulator [Bacteroidaceae bacterium]|nr:helix-turn-helix transcriptional regulator [Bacteroidaceae bacterium]